VTENRKFIKRLRLNRLMFGNGLLTSEGDFWIRQRRLAQPAFHRERIAAYGSAMVGYAERMLATWQDGETRDVHADMMTLTLEIVAKTLFDADIGGDARDVGEAMEVLMETSRARLNSLLLVPERFPTPGNIRLWQAVRRLDQISYRIIRQRRASSEEKGDLLSLLLRARDEEDGSRMTDKQLRNEALTLCLAGHETTAIALSSTWYLLALHPEVEATLLAELQAVPGGRAPTVTDLEGLRYSEMVVSESMRLFPPAWIVGREARRETQIGGYRVPGAGRHHRPDEPVGDASRSALLR